MSLQFCAGIGSCCGTEQRLPYLKEASGWNRHQLLFVAMCQPNLTFPYLGAIAGYQKFDNVNKQQQVSSWKGGKLLPEYLLDIQFFRFCYSGKKAHSNHRATVRLLLTAQVEFGHYQN